MDVIIDDAPDRAIERHRQRAEERGVTLEEELHNVLTRPAWSAGDEATTERGGDSAPAREPEV